MPNAYPITPEALERLNAALDELRWTDSGLARRLRVTPHTISSWRKGKTPLPDYAFSYLELAVLMRRAFEPLEPDSSWLMNGRGNPKRRARMDAQALQRFKDAGKL